MPFAVPDWMPGWLPIAVLVPVLLYALVFLAIPFAVFGLKGRLDMIEARLDEIQGEIRLLSLRLPEHAHGPERFESAALNRPGTGRPLIPPAGAPARPPEAAASPGRSEPPGDGQGRRRAQIEYDDAGRPADRAAQRRRSADRPDRAEPRLDWPR
jgi:hypothetical protein